MMTTTADGGTVRITRAGVESRDAAGLLLEAHPPTEEELLILAGWVAAQTPMRDAAALARVAAAPVKDAVRAAAARLTKITTDAAAAALLPPLAPTTTADALAAIRTLDTRQRAITAALGDVATILHAVGRLVVTEVNE
jgi:hypothetical protein